MTTTLRCPKCVSKGSTSCAKSSVKFPVFFKASRNNYYDGISGPRLCGEKIISGPRNSLNGSAKILSKETNKMVQFLGQETDIIGERIFMCN